MNLFQAGEVFFARKWREPSQRGPSTTRPTKPTRRLLALAPLLIAAAASLAPAASVGAEQMAQRAAVSPVDSKLDEVRRAFTLGGKPIPPEIFRDMGDADMADSGSILVTVDLEAAVGSNLYYDDIQQSGGWVAQKKIDKQAINGWEETAYHFVGAAANGLLVVVASYNGGGSGTFYTLHVLDLAAAKAFDSDGKIYDRIDLTALREIPLGDRWVGEVTISGDTILVTTTRKGPADDSGEVSTRRIEARRP